MAQEMDADLTLSPLVLRLEVKYGLTLGSWQTVMEWSQTKCMNKFDVTFELYRICSAEYVGYSD